MSDEPSHRLCSQVLVEVGGRIERLLRPLAAAHPNATLLDVGCWDGELSARCGAALGAGRMLGVEVYEGPAAEAEARGLEVARVDLEAGRLPWPDNSVDVVVCNQVLEHLKNVWLPMTEMHRVLRVGGHAVLSVPNLASLHNRVLLGLGRQPTSIRVFGPHVRGYGFHEFREFVARDGAYEVESASSVGFYPLPTPWSAPLARLWPAAGHTTIVLARKTGAPPPWRAYIDGAVDDGMQTFYG
ncbi:MAG TPA: methyltransferase domain-containing protein [Solirubrobacterales bacterium]|jgi:methionine biosynthesis protein MetW|nr:methyltransferase domain-containing protein [Solirubrobacterales bacterium]